MEKHENNFSGIYVIRNKVNGKFYVGSATNIRNRFAAHISALKRNCHKNKHLQSAWNKYGEDNFEFDILEKVEVLTELIPREQEWIDKLQACKFGYNLSPTAGNNLGYRFSDEIKEKFRQAAIGRKASDETKEKMRLRMQGNNNPMYGRKHTQETIQKMKRNRGDMTGSNNPFYGRAHSEETKRKIGQANAGCMSGAKLTVIAVKEIKRRMKEKPKELMWKDFDKYEGNKYGVAPKTIRNVRRGYNWTNIT